MTIDDESIETLLARSLDDDQESRRYLLELADNSEPPRVWEAASEYADNAEANARLLAKTILRACGEAPHLLELGFHGSEQMLPAPESSEMELTRIVSAFLRSLHRPNERTLRQRLATMSTGEREDVFSSFAAEARVSSAYEGMDLKADGMAEQLGALMERGAGEARPKP